MTIEYLKTIVSDLKAGVNSQSVSLRQIFASHPIDKLEAYIHQDGFKAVGEFRDIIEDIYSNTESIEKEFRLNYLKRLMIQSREFYSENSVERTKRFFNEIEIDLLDNALIHNDIDMVCFIIKQRGSVSTSASNVFSFIKPTQNEMYKSIISLLSEMLPSNTNGELIKSSTRALSFGFNKWVYTDEFPERLDYLCNNIPDIALKIDIKGLLISATSVFKPNCVAACLKYVNNTHDYFFTESVSLIWIGNINNTLKYDDVKQTIDILDDHFKYANDKKRNENFARIFDALALSEKHHEINLKIHEHPLLKNENIYRLLNSNTKELHQSIAISLALNHIASESNDLTCMADEMQFTTLSL